MEIHINTFLEFLWVVVAPLAVALRIGFEIGKWSNKS